MATGNKSTPAGWGRPAKPVGVNVSVRSLGQEFLGQEQMEQRPDQTNGTYSILMAKVR